MTVLALLFRLSFFFLTVYLSGTFHVSPLLSKALVNSGPISGGDPQQCRRADKSARCHAEPFQLIGGAASERFFPRQINEAQI